MHKLNRVAQLSRNFSRHEFECKCGCGFNTPDAELVRVLQVVREHFIVLPVSINSACRCEDHNAKVGGAKNSAHLQGIAADIVVHGLDPSEVFEFLDSKYPDTYGIGKYNTFTHIDVRAKKARW